jgi:hypothetical protein
MYGIKTNHHKCEVIVLGASKKESSQISNVLNCGEGKLPIKYLGILVSHKMIYSTDLIEVGVKVGKSLPAW